MSDWLRKYATPISFVTFLGTGLTGLMMFFGVRGGPIGDIHEWLGMVFVAALALHLARNRRGMVAMMSTASGKLIAGGLSLALTALILVSAPWGTGGGHHGGGHGPWRVVNAIADAPIEKMAPALGLSPDEAVARLRRGGVPVGSAKESLSTIARDHGQEMPQMLNLLLSARDDEDAT